MEKVVGTFFKELGLQLPHAGTWAGVEGLVRSNLGEPSARHLMVLTRSNAALGLLFDRGTLAHGSTEIIFGSDFPLDQSDLQVCLDIQRIKIAMAVSFGILLPSARPSWSVLIEGYIKCAFETQKLSSWPLRR